MRLNRARRVEEVMELEAELPAAETQCLELEAGQSQVAVELSAVETQRVDTEMDRMEAEKLAWDPVRAT